MRGPDLILLLDNPEDFTIELTDAPLRAEKNYNNLRNKPRLNGVELIGNRTLKEVGAMPEDGIVISLVTNKDIDDMINNFAW